METKSGNPTFKTLIMNTEKILYDGEANSVTSENDTAKFDILPGHTNFISIIKNYLILVTNTGETKKFELEQGIVMVYKNVVKIYLGIKQAL